MNRAAACALLCAAVLSAQPDRNGDAVLQRIKARFKDQTSQLPAYVCLQTIERAQRLANQSEFQIKDTIRLEVTLIGDQERFAWPDSARFEDKDLREMVNRGMVGTGNFALHARHVLGSNSADFTARGETVHKERRALHYGYEVPWEKSRYHIRLPPHDQVVAFRGLFVVDAETLDLVRLEVESDEIPPEIGLDRVKSVLEYARVRIGDADYMLPKSSDLTMVALDGTVSRNRIELSGCRQYVADSKLVFDETSSVAAPESAEKTREGLELPPRSIVELALDSDIVLAQSAAGDPIRATLVRPIKENDRVIVPEGATLRGRIVRLEKYSVPFEYYEIALQFDALEAKDAQHAFAATLEDAGPASGLIRQQKRLNPTFTTNRRARLDVLVREVQRGQGVLQWEAKRSKIEKGFRMRWRVEAP